MPISNEIYNKRFRKKLQTWTHLTFYTVTFCLEQSIITIRYFAIHNKFMNKLNTVNNYSDLLLDLPQLLFQLVFVA